jgi:hypothetical protein
LLEIEKSDESLFNILLRILDEGTLTNDRGEDVSFKDAVIVLTSNMGTKEAQEAVRLWRFGVREPPTGHAFLDANMLRGSSDSDRVGDLALSGTMMFCLCEKPALFDLKVNSTCSHRDDG